jgi:hypothetical protein
MTLLTTTLKSIILPCLFTTVTVSLQAQIQVEAGPDLNHCLGDFTELNATITGGMEPFTISWSPDVELSATDVQSPTVSPTMHTVYRVVVTDATGAVAKDEVKIKVFPKPNIFTNGTVLIQPGESITLMADAQGGTPPYQYSWKPSTGLASANSSNPTATPKYSTIYNVLVKDSKGCTNSGQVLVNISGDKTSNAASQAGEQ